MPLLEEFVLQEDVVADFIAEALLCFNYCLRLCKADVLIPFLPWLAVVFSLECHKESVVFHPICVLFKKCVVVIISFKSGICLFKHTENGVINHAVVDILRMVAEFRILIILGSEKTLLLKSFKVDKIGVACMNRAGLIG